jgi:uncharacterized protein YjbI with pentapeptide repeats
MRKQDSKNAFNCYCGEFQEHYKKDIREKVCDKKLFQTIDDKSYCVLHFPSSDKWGNFWSVLQQKLNENNFDFRGVWFPQDKERESFDTFDFTGYANFSDAIFAEDITFRDAKFDDVYFNKAKFLAKAIFTNAEFREIVSFSDTEFFDAQFNSVKFNKKADFNKTEFVESANFFHADFLDFAEFRDAKFAQANFSEVVFSGVTFQNAVFGNELTNENALVNFKNSTFAGDFSVFSIKSYIKTDFSEATFVTTIDFSNANFYKEVRFVSTNFKNKVFFLDSRFEELAYFNGSIFEFETSFFKSHFVKDVWLYKTEFQKKADFGQATFEAKAFFHETTFVEEANFSGTQVFKVISFQSATFQSYAMFDGHASHEQFKEETIFEFQYTRFTSPDLVSFHSMILSPNWFVDTDVRKVVFVNPNWNFTAENQLDILRGRGIYYPEKLFRITCHQLATNAEENNRYDEASNFRRLALQMEKSEKWESLRKSFKSFSKKESYSNKSLGFFPLTIVKLAKAFLLSVFNLLLHYIYLISSFYGESWTLALGVLLSLIFIIFPIIYTQINFKTCSKDRPIAASLSNCENEKEEIKKNCTCNEDPIIFKDAIVQSLTTATLQNVEYRKPLTFWSEFWIILEKIFAPLQAALLALAIRRKFMR